MALIAWVIVLRLAPSGGRIVQKSEPDLPLLPGSKADRTVAARSVAADEEPSSGAASPAARAAVSTADVHGWAAAARLMIASPPGTDAKLENVNPRILQAVFQRGKRAIGDDDNEEAAAEGARLMNAAGALGYGPARALIAVEYPTSAVLQGAVPSADAVRYSLDPLLTSDESGAGRRPFLVLLATYFAGRQALPTYASDLLAALHDDGRLQSDRRLEVLLGLLAHVRGACTALAAAIVKARSVSSPECSSGLKLQIENYLRSRAPPDAEAEARRRALRFLATQDAFQDNAR